MIAILVGSAACVWAQEPLEAAPRGARNSVRQLCIARPDGSEMRPLPAVAGYESPGSPCWSHDGRLLAFDAKRGEQGGRAIIVMNADGTNPRILSDGAMPSFSPQGKRIAFSRYAESRGVWVMSSEGPQKELVLLDETGWGAQWSPDGKQICYATDDSDGANLVTFDLIEGVITPLFEKGNSPYQNFFWNFDWSPDSRQIVFKGERTSGELQIGIVDARGAKHGLIVRHEGNVRTGFDWGHDGSRILFSQPCPERGGRRQIYFLDPKTDDPPRLLPGQNPEVVYNDVAISPDGTKLAIACQVPDKKPNEP